MHIHLKTSPVSCSLQMVHRPGTTKLWYQWQKRTVKAKHFSFPKNFHRIRVTPLGPDSGLYFQVLVTASPSSPYSYLSLSRGRHLLVEETRTNFCPQSPRQKEQPLRVKCMALCKGEEGERKKGGRNHWAGCNPMWRAREECSATGWVGNESKGKECSRPMDAELTNPGLQCTNEKTRPGLNEQKKCQNMPFKGVSEKIENCWILGLKGNFPCHSHSKQVCVRLPHVWQQWSLKKKSSCGHFCWEVCLTFSSENLDLMRSQVVQDSANLEPWYRAILEK